MDLCGVRTLRGPNRWVRFPVFEIAADLGDPEGRDARRWNGLRERLLDRLPGPGPFDPAREEMAGWQARLMAGDLPPPRLVELLARIVLGQGGSKATFAKTVAEGSGRYRFILGYDDEAVDRAALETCWRLLRAGLGDGPIDVAGEIAALRTRANGERLGPGTAAIVGAARARGIPARRLNAGSLVQLGWGSRQHRIWTAISDRTGMIAADIASDKELTRTLLRRAGVPVPAGRLVESASDAWKAAQEVGLPVVVKPRNANHAQGVSIGLTTREQVERAFAIAAGIRGESPTDVLVERFIRGDEHRLLVVAGRLVAAYRGEPAQVVGNGRQSVAELVAALNCDPRRGTEWHYPLDRVEIDDVARLVLADQGLTPDAVPPAGARVILQRTADRCLDVTDQVHPEVAARAVEAAAVVGLDIAGIDLLAEDIARPLEAQGGAIVEVNAGPGLMGHLMPASGRPRPVGEAIVASLFPEGDDGRIPVLAVTGGPEAAEVARRLARRHAEGGVRVGLACSDGLFLGERRIADEGRTTASLARDLLTNPLVELAVVEVRPEDVREEGLPFDFCDRAYVTGWEGAATTEPFAEAARVLVESVRPGGAAVLRRDDPRAEELAGRCAGGVEWEAGECSGFHEREC